MNNRLCGKTVVITGASGGLGEQIAYECARSRANLILLSRQYDKLLLLKEKIEREYAVRCLVKGVDISKYESIEPLFMEIEKTCGAIDVLVNNAGYGVFAEAEKAALADIQGMFAVNVVGLIACTQAVIPGMKKRKSGHIINIASQAGKMATPKSSIYAASKHAVLGFTNSLRMEMSHWNVYVTAVNPGPIATDFFKTADKSGNYVKNIGRFILSPEKVAAKICRSMMTKQREINVPHWMNTASVFYQLFPRMVEKIGRRAFLKK